MTVISRGKGLPSRRVLLVADSPFTKLFASRLLREQQHKFTHVADGSEAMRVLAQERFDLVVSEWFMPTMDGIELVRRLRERGSGVPVILLGPDESFEPKAYALSAGANACLTDPLDEQEFVETMQACLLEQGTVEAEAPTRSWECDTEKQIVCVAASMGGVEAVTKLVQGLPDELEAPLFVVLHGDPWTLELFTERHLAPKSERKVVLVSDGCPVERRGVYIAPGAMHMRVEAAAGSTFLRVEDGPFENYVKPAANVLFRSAADEFGSRCVGVVLTGLGKDGTAGAAAIVDAGGRVVVQDPATASAPSMPSSVLRAGVPCDVVRLEQIAEHVAAWERIGNRSILTR